jgi:uncharacterized protein
VVSQQRPDGASSQDGQPRRIAAAAGSFFDHAKQPGWLEEVDRCVAAVKPESWKGYTIGDPLNPRSTKYPWRLDDEKLMYPFYEKAVKAGVNTICIHKGLLPRDYEKSAANSWQYATVDDLGKAVKDWPQMNFVIYRAALRQFLEIA